MDFHSKVLQYGNEVFVQREGQGWVRVLGGRGHGGASHTPTRLSILEQLPRVTFMALPLTRV